MTGLRDLKLPDPATWTTAEAFEPPGVRRYRIADDCLRAEPTKPAVVEAASGTTLTYGELDARSARLANHLVGSGLVAGDRVAVKLSQSIDMAIAVLGVLRAGGVVVPLSNVLATGGLLHRLGDADPRLLVCSGDAEERQLAADADVTLMAVEHLAQVVASGSTSVSPATAGDADEPALLLYTSGTTGKPKGVLQAQRFLLGHHALDLAFDRVRPNDIAYSPVDWTWAGGLMLGLLVPLAHGLTVVAHREAGFDPHATVAMMQRHDVSIGLFPPTVLRMLREAGAMDGDAVRRSRLRAFVTGAEAVEPELIDWADGCGITVNNAYGQTEANALVGHAACLGRLDQRSMGRPYPGHHVEVLDDHLSPVAVGVPGQLAVRADDPVCMLGYWNQPEATAAKVVSGWLLTGDTAHRADDGTLWFHGRGDDIIKSGAYRLGPAEIEAAVLTAPGVLHCAVVGLPDPIRGQVVTAAVELAPGVDGDDALADAIRDRVRSAVGAHAYPRIVRFVDRLPRTTTGKIDRATVRTELAGAGQPAAGGVR